MAKPEEQISDLDVAIAAAETLYPNRELLKQLWERVADLYRQSDRAEGRRALSDFRLGDRVYWDSGKRGERIYGIIDRINAKSCGVQTTRGHWRVHWSFLRKEGE